MESQIHGLAWIEHNRDRQTDNTEEEERRTCDRLVVDDRRHWH